MHFLGLWAVVHNPAFVPAFHCKPCAAFEGQHRGFPLQSGSPWAAVHGQAALVAGSFAAWWFIYIDRNGVLLNATKAMTYA